MYLYMGNFALKLGNFALKYYDGWVCFSLQVLD